MEAWVEEEFWNEASPVNVVVVVKDAVLEKVAVPVRFVVPPTERLDPSDASPLTYAVPCTAIVEFGVAVPSPRNPRESRMSAVEVAYATVDEETRRSGVAAPLVPAIERRPYGVVDPMPKFPAMVDAVVVPVTMRVPLMVVVSVMESPSVVLFSTEKVETEVVESVVPPEMVSDFAKRSPSASKMNLVEPFTDAVRRLVSAPAEVGLMTSVAPSGFASATPGAHAPKTCAPLGTEVKTKRPAMVEVAVEVAVMEEAVSTSPTVVFPPTVSAC